VTIETDPVAFARDQTADRLTDRFEDTGIEVETREGCPDSVFISQASDSNVLIIEDELDDLGRGVTVRKQVLTNPHDSGPGIEVRIEVDADLVNLRQTITHLNNELDVVESDIGDHTAEAVIDSSVEQDAFLTTISNIRSACAVRVDYLRGWGPDRNFIIHFRPTAD